MIRISNNQFTPGSLPPKMVSDVPDMTMDPVAQSDLDTYVELKAWEFGMNILILGGPLTGKTSTGLYFLRTVFKETGLNPVYWTEADFHSDLRNLWRYEGLVEKSPNDGALWQEYMEWERSFWDLKEETLLFIDDAGRGTTPNQRYEFETMLRRRRDMGLATVVAADYTNWGAVPNTTSGLFIEGFQIVLETVHAER